MRGLYISGNWGPKGRDKNTPIPYCPAARKLYFVDVDNQVYPCATMISPDYKIGRLDPETGEIIFQENLLVDQKLQEGYGMHDCMAYELLYLNEPSLYL